MSSISTECVYLVDDDEDDRFLIHKVFTQHSPHCKLKLLNNGEELLAALKNATCLPNLILLDLNMPLMGGFEALRLIRQQPNFSFIPIIILTTSDEVTDRQRAIDLKASGFITKPVTIEALNQLILHLRYEWLENTCAATVNSVQQSKSC